MLRQTTRADMESLLLIVCVLSCSTLVLSRGAGRAFPIASENYIIENFQGINPSINWDETNFLVDLSGLYANCESLTRPLGVVNVDRQTQDGANIGGYVDSIQGSENHVDATNSYITEILRRWNSNQQCRDLIRRSVKFGCSVRPGCNGVVVVACLFSASQLPPTQPRLPPPTRPSTARPTTTTTTTTTTTPRPAPVTAPKIRIREELFSGDVRAMAFTKEQYKVTEQLIDHVWDPSHYLENLSGYETDCSMIGTLSWDFDHTERFKQLHPYNIKGLYGYAQNRGSTPDALAEILPVFKPTIKAVDPKDLGCSLIPDCIADNGLMYVVVSCLYEF